MFLIVNLLYNNIINLTLEKISTIVRLYLYFNILFYSSLFFMDQFLFYLIGIGFCDYTFSILYSKDIIISCMTDKDLPNSHEFKIENYKHKPNDVTLQISEEWSGLIGQKDGYRILGNYLNFKVDSIIDVRTMEYADMRINSHSNRVSQMVHAVSLSDVGITIDHENEIARLKIFALEYKEKYPTFYSTINKGTNSALKYTNVYGKK